MCLEEVVRVLSNLEMVSWEAEVRVPPSLCFVAEATALSASTAATWAANGGTMDAQVAP